MHTRRAGHVITRPLNCSVRRLLMRDQVDQCRYLNLRELSEPEDNGLRLGVEEMHVGDEAEELVVGESSFGLTHKIEHTEACRVFELYWDMYCLLCSQRVLCAPRR